MALSYVCYKYQNYFEIVVIYCVQKITQYEIHTQL